MRRFDPQRRATLHTPCTNTAYIPRKHPANTLQIHTAHTPQPLTRKPHTPQTRYMDLLRSSTTYPAFTHSAGPHKNFITSS